MTGPSQVQPGRPERRTHPEPVFVLAPPRSFSTVAVALLAGHPQVYGFPELLVFANATVGDLVGDGTEKERYPEKFRRGRMSGVCRAIAEVHEGVQTEDAVVRAHTWLTHRAGWPMHRVLAHLLEAVSPLVGAEKSPDTVGTEAAFARCLSHYPDARYLHLTRHPVTTQRSMHEQLPEPANRTARVVGAATSWYLSHSRIRDRLAALPAGQWMRVRGEDLLREPEALLPAVLDWLDLDKSEAVIARMLRTEGWRFTGFGASGQLYGGDHTFLAHPRLRPVPDPGPVRFDPAWGLPEEMVRRMSRLAAELGYDAA
ncbi:sulfotransferase family protein [Streptomyces sp. MAR4 CNX-425]|uniref:sulfotransferase family protein n=1 Tax=Streptomyces sp. MAR4 CNX-425 TaxID=3406343 RepID=UPI003B510C15